MQYTDLEIKLIRLMLNISAHEGEIINSATMLAKSLRKRGIDAEGMIALNGTQNAPQGANRASSGASSPQDNWNDIFRRAQEEVKRRQEANKAYRDAQDKADRENRERAERDRKAQSQSRPRRQAKAYRHSFKEDSTQNYDSGKWAFDFGQYKGRTIGFGDGYDQDYLQWIVNTMESNRPLLVAAIKRYWKAYGKR